MNSPIIEQLIKIFSRFPTVGPRTASRFVFYLIQKPKEEVEELIKTIENLKKEIKNCSFCFNPFEGEGDLCQICSDKTRNQTLLCLVEKETDLIALEKTRKYKGRYFILGGAISALKQDELKKLRTKDLEERLKNNLEIKEIIIAVNPTTEGEATALYLERMLKPLNIKSTRLARGLPLGGELEYADEETLSQALENRK